MFSVTKKLLTEITKDSKNNDLGGHKKCIFYPYIKENLVSWCWTLQTSTYSSISSSSFNLTYSYGFFFPMYKEVFFNTQSYTGTRKCLSEFWYFPVLPWLPESSAQCRDGLFWAEIYYHWLCVSASLLSALLTPLFSLVFLLRHPLLFTHNLIHALNWTNTRNAFLPAFTCTAHTYIQSQSNACFHIGTHGHKCAPCFSLVTLSER